MKTIELKKVARQIQRGTYAAVDFVCCCWFWIIMGSVKFDSSDHYGVDNGDYGDR